MKQGNIFTYIYLGRSNDIFDNKDYSILTVDGVTDNIYGALPK